MSSKIKKLNYEYKWHVNDKVWPIKKEQRRMRRKAIINNEREAKIQYLSVSESKMVKIMSLIVANWCWNAISLCVTHTLLCYELM